MKRSCRAGKAWRKCGGAAGLRNREDFDGARFDWRSRKCQSVLSAMRPALGSASSSH